MAVSKTYEQDLPAVSKLRQHVSEVAIFPAAGDPPDPLPVPPATVPASVLSRSRASAAATDAVRQMLARSYDLVHVEGYHLMQHLPPTLDEPLVLGTQNIEHQLWQQRAARAGRPERPALLAEAERTLLEEVAAWQRADVCIAVTAEDAAVIQAAAPDTPVWVVPAGVDHEPAAGRADHQAAAALRRRYGGAPLLVFGANFAYAPNVEAARYLSEQVLPGVRAVLPETVLLLPGNAPPPAVQQLADPPWIVVPGKVPSLRAYLLAADLVVVPLLSGGGVKMKVLEALRLGRPVVTTPVGAQGLLPAAAGAIAVADDREQFSGSIVALWRDPAHRRAMAEAALDLGSKLSTWDDAARKLLDCYGQLLDARGGVGSTRVAAGAGMVQTPLQRATKQGES